MGLFKKRPKEEPAAAPVKEYSFILSNGFRGYKKFPIVVHGNKEAEETGERLKDADLRGLPIVFREATANGSPYLSVFIDGNRIGAIFDNSQILQITGGKIEAFFARPEAETVIDKAGPVTRHKVCLFAKYT